MNFSVKNHQLRNCSAKIFEATREDGHKFFLLRSYASNVCDITRANGNWEILLYPRWDYSQTTRQHVRKFMEDVMGFSVSATEIRKALKNSTNGFAVVNGVSVIVNDSFRRGAKTFWQEIGVYGEWGF